MGSSYVGLAVLVAKARAATHVATEAAGKRLEAAAKGDSPVLTGALRGSIEADPPAASGESVEVRVHTSGAPDEYAGYVEGGTSRQAPQPFMEQAVMTVGPELRAGLAAASRREF